MRKLLGLAIILLAMGIMLGFVGCKDPGSGVNDIDYTNYASPNFSIMVKNDTNKKLVAFKGTPSPSTLISGIPAASGEHGLKKTDGLFTTTNDFVLFLVTEDDYLANKNNLSILENRPFTRLYAYYNTNAVNSNVYRISSMLGGTKRIVLQNATSFNVELREDSAEYGQTIGYTTSNTLNTTFYVEARDYTVFPVFRKFHSTWGEIMSGYPIFEEDGPLKGTYWYTWFNLNSTDVVTINALDFVAGMKIQAGAAFLRVNNNSGVGIGLWDGLSPVTTESGGQAINPNGDMIFPIYMSRIQDAFSPYAQKAQYRIGTPGTQHIIPLPTTSYEVKDGEGNVINTINNVYLEGKVYEITVTGANANTLSFSSIVPVGDWVW